MPSLRRQSSKASHRMSCVQPAPHYPGYGVLGSKRQTIHRLNHQAARQGWGQGGLSCQEAVRPCCVGFSTSPVLYHHFRLNPLTLTGGKRAIKLRGWRCVLKSQKRISMRCLLHVRSENRMVSAGFRVVAEIFRAG